MPLITTEQLPELVTRELSEKIIQNEIKPGERILESKIAEEMGISRSPVREALRILEKNRLVELVPRKGARVTRITTQHIEWFYEIYETLYALVARKAAENATEADLVKMRQALDNIEKAADKRDVLGYYDSTFEYAAIGLTVANNPLLEQMVVELWPSNRRIQYASLQFRADELNKNKIFFQDCSRHVEAGNGPMAEAVIRRFAQNEKAFAMKIANGHSTVEKSRPGAGAGTVA